MSFPPANKYPERAERTTKKDSLNFVNSKKFFSVILVIKMREFISVQNYEI